VDLSVHEDDTTFDKDFALHTWDLKKPVKEYFRYLRILGTGKCTYRPSEGAVDDWSYVLVVSGFEVYGSLRTAKKPVVEIEGHESDDNVLLELASEDDHEPTTQPKKERQKKTFTYQFDRDTNGIVFYLGGYPKVDVFASSIKEDKKIRDFISRNEIRCWTKNEPSSWFVVDFGPTNSVTPTMYTLRYGSSGNYCYPKSWLLQASNKFTRPKETDKYDPASDVNWVTLRKHENDPCFSAGDYASKTWNIDYQGTDAFRYFRVIQTGKNSYKGKEGSTDEWSDVFVLIGFELYGCLLFEQEDKPDDDSDAELDELLDETDQTPAPEPKKDEQQEKIQNAVRPLLEILKQSLQEDMKHLQDSLASETHDIQSNLQQDLKRSEFDLSEKLKAVERKIPVSDWDFVFSTRSAKE